MVNSVLLTETQQFVVLSTVTVVGGREAKCTVSTGITNSMPVLRRIMLHMFIIVVVLLVARLFSVTRLNATPWSHH